MITQSTIVNLVNQSTQAIQTSKGIVKASTQLETLLEQAHQLTAALTNHL
jgi:hypothetical protein